MRDNAWRYSLLRDRLVRDPCGRRLRLMARIKPNVIRRLRRPWRARVERYHIDGHGKCADVAAKYAVGCDERIEREVKAVKQLTNCGAARQLGVLLPELIEIQGIWGQGKGLLTPWKRGGTLWQHLREDVVDPEYLSTIIREAARTLRSLHSLSAEPSDVDDKQAIRSAGELLKPNPGDDVARWWAQPVLASIPVKQIEAELGDSWCWIHGDCFSYQFILDEEGELRLWLCDWDSARIDRTGFCDLAQLWATLELAIALSPRLAARAPAFWEDFQDGYGRELSCSCLFRVLELQALIRFSPRTPKFRVVVPIRTASGATACADASSERAVATYDAIIRERIAQLPGFS